MTDIGYYPYDDDDEAFGAKMTEYFKSDAHAWSDAYPGVKFCPLHRYDNGGGAGLFLFEAGRSSRIMTIPLVNTVMEFEARVSLASSRSARAMHFG